MPQAIGVLPGDIPIRGARAQHCATVRPENKVCRVCGSHPAMWANGPNAASARACARRRGNGEGANLGAYPVRRFAPRPNENGQGRKLNAGAGLQPARWLGCRNRPTSLCARSDASDTAPRNYLYACACACLTESYDNLCPMRQTRRGIRLASRNWTPPGGRSHHPVHPLAGFVVRQHHVQAKFLAQHPGNGSAHGVLLPAGVQHQLETGRALRVA